MKDVDKDYEIRTYPKQFEKGSALASYLSINISTLLKIKEKEYFI